MNQPFSFAIHYIQLHCTLSEIWTPTYSLCHIFYTICASWPLRCILLMAFQNIIEKRTLRSMNIHRTPRNLIYLTYCYYIAIIIVQPCIQSHTTSVYCRRLLFIILCPAKHKALCMYYKVCMAYTIYNMYSMCYMLCNTVSLHTILHTTVL